MPSGLALFSFLAGILTILAPCVLPVLPVIIGGSLTGGKDWRRALIITISLAVSLMVFTILLKLSSVLFSVPPQVWQYISGGLIAGFGLFWLFPALWDQITVRARLLRSSDLLLTRAATHRGWLGAVLIGFSLGPVFSSCSPTYALILATVLPVDLRRGLIYLFLYAIGLALTLFLAAILGQSITTRLRFAILPESWFRRGLGLLFVLTGLVIALGYQRNLELFFAERLGFDVTKVELNFLPSGNDRVSDNSARFNVLRPYQAPELTGIVSWLNSPSLRLADLKGKVVVIDFWTYSCINCLRTLPYLKDWAARYQADGLVVIGVHAPEFAFEKVRANVETAVQENGIEYPVALDNDFATWTAYQNNSWPAKYFIDRDGLVRHIHIGEGQYIQSESIIRQLLAENGHSLTAAPMDISASANVPPVKIGQTPETYLSYRRADRFALSPNLQPDRNTDYTLQSTSLHEWSLGGKWNIGPETDESLAAETSLRLKFAAKDVYLVMGANQEVDVRLRLNGTPLTADNGGGDDVGVNGSVAVGTYRLYHLVHLSEFVDGAILEITFPKGVTINAFTFGS